MVRTGPGPGWGWGVGFRSAEVPSGGLVDPLASPPFCL